VTSKKNQERVEVTDLLPKPPEAEPEPAPESEGHAVTRTLGSWAIEHGDALEVLKRYPDNHFDALLSDPPYGISFMGKGWDYGIPPIETWQEALRVLKPGAPLIAFGGTRTFHRLAVAIEDAGFEIRDCFSWLYGSGFPKSLDVSKAIDAAAGAEREVVGPNPNAVGRTSNKTGGKLIGGHAQDRSAVDCLTAPATDAARTWSGYGTALKPAWEPAILARKPLDGTVAQNAAKWGVGGLAIDACRIGSGGKAKIEPLDAGRWPANVLLDEGAAAMLDEQSGITRSNDPRPDRGKGGIWSPSADGIPAGPQDGDSGGASRFFYVAKASRREREAGLREAGKGVGALRDGERSEGSVRNHHPTVKPITLARHLATLLLPPAREGDARKLLVPFSGSGSEVIGALLAGWDDVTGIEREAEYVEIARARIGFAVATKKPRSNT
jgi:site-specific DNA-methyltransferase (adenine-specific)